MVTARKFLIVVLLAALGLPYAGYAQETTAEPASAQWQASLTNLGLGESLRLAGQIAQHDLYIPVPAGLTAVDLRASVQRSADVESGFLEACSENTVLATLPLPANGATITLPLEGAVIRNGILSLTLATRLRSQDDVCATALVGAWLSLNDAQIEYSGSAAPATVASFLPSILNRLTIVVPRDVNAAEAAAALRLTSAITARYRPQKVDVQLAALAARDTLPATVANSPFERTIVIRSSDTAAVALQSAGALPLLVISGGADELLRQVDLFFGSANLALASSVQVQTLATPTPAAPGSGASFDALGFTNLQVSGIGRMELPFNFAQADLGEPINSLAFRVAGIYTPLQAGDRGTLVLLVNNTLVDASALDDSGSFDRSITVPGDVLSRDNTLTVRFDYVPAQGDCRAGLEPFTGQISGSSYVQFGSGQSLPAGFARLPQAFVGAFQTAFEQLDLAALANAVNVVTALQRTTSTPLQPSVVDWSAALTAKTPALLVSATAGSVTALNPPLSAEPIRVVKSDGTELLRIDANAQFSALEAFEQNGRDVLLVAGKPSAVNALTRSLLTDTLGWYGLQGDTWLQVGESAPVSLTLQGGKLTAQPLTPAEAPWYTQVLPPLLFVVAVIVVLVLMALAYPRVVRRTPTGAKS